MITIPSFSRKIRYYPTLVGAAVFFMLALAILVLMPSQIKIRADQTITARTFPAALAIMMLGGSIMLAAKDLYRLARKLPIEVAELDLGTEIRALILLALLAFFALLMRLIGFIPGSVVFGLLMLVYFRVKKPAYYAVVAVAAIIVGVIFRYALNVRLP